MSELLNCVNLRNQCYDTLLYLLYLLLEDHTEDTLTLQLSEAWKYPTQPNT